MCLNTAAARPVRRGRFPLCLLLLAVLVLSPMAQAQAPESLVLALELSSSTHARPASGAVISADGLVVVPAGFVRGRAELVLMDRGTDLGSDARGTTLIARSTEFGLAVLKADRLTRPPVRVSRDAPRPGQSLSVHAFPTADQLAEGAAPLSGTLQLVTEDGALVPRAPGDWPAVAGPVFNRCGQLAGFYLPPEEESPARLATPDELREVLGDFASDLDDAWCEQAPATAAPARQGTPGRSELEILADPGAPTTAQTDSEPAFQLPEPLPPEPEPETEEPATDTGAMAQPAAPVAQAAQPPPETPSWPYWLGAVVALAMLGVVALFLARRRADEDTDTDGVGAADSRQFPVTMTQRFDDGQRRQRQGLLVEGAPPAPSGRAEGELRINHPSVEHRHAGFLVRDGRLYVTPLHATAAIDINGVPCLDGEVLAVDGELRLGEVTCRLTLGDPREPDA